MTPTCGLVGDEREVDDDGDGAENRLRQTMDEERKRKVPEEAAADADRPADPRQAAVPRRQAGDEELAHLSLSLQGQPLDIAVGNFVLIQPNDEKVAHSVR